MELALDAAVVGLCLILICLNVKGLYELLRR